MGAIAGAAGTLGEFVMKALKRDAGVTQLAAAAVGHRRRRPARPRRAAVLRGAGLLPLGALVFRQLAAPALKAAPASVPMAPCASSASTPAFGPPASASSSAKPAMLRYVASGTIRTATRGARATCPGGSRSSSTACARSPRATRRPAPRSRSSSSTSTRSPRCCSARRAAPRCRRWSRTTSPSPSTPPCR